MRIGDDLLKCNKCNKDAIWGGDFSYEDYNIKGNGIISNFLCECGNYFEVYYNIENDCIDKIENIEMEEY